jgi:hypothetical protein
MFGGGGGGGYRMIGDG